MGTNFRLSYNNGYGYTDLFPYVKIDDVAPSILTSRDYAISVKIPPSEELVQKIPVEVPAKYIGKQAVVELIYSKNSDIYDYGTITQINVVSDGIEVIRLYRKPINSIHVVLILNDNEKNYLRDSEVDVTVGPFTGFVQTIPMAFTESQSVAQFFTELLTEGEQAKRDYSKISQIEVRSDRLLIYRFSEGPTSEIKLKLRFREGGA